MVLLLSVVFKESSVNQEGQKGRRLALSWFTLSKIPTTKVQTTNVFKKGKICANG
jgi:hypothetical protein